MLQWLECLDTKVKRFQICSYPNCIRICSVCPVITESAFRENLYSFRRIRPFLRKMLLSVETPRLIHILSFYHHGVSVNLLVMGVGILDLFDLMLFQVTYQINCSKTYLQQFVNNFSTYEFTDTIQHHSQSTIMIVVMH
jgi:hypothetical protein